MTKNQHRQLAHALALAFILLSAGRAYALDAFECVRDLMPITEQSEFQSHRKDVEKPFMATPKFMAFPEVVSGVVTGFYLYTNGDKAWYYDSIEDKDGSSNRLLTDLKRTNEFSHFYLVAQPLGLESVILHFMPAFGIRQTTRDGPVMLGSSVMPVVGAFMSRKSDRLSMVYRNPEGLDETDLKQWISVNSSRRPAAAAPIEIDKQYVHLATKKVKSQGELMRPLKAELAVRKAWVQNHNLTQATFKDLSRVMDTTCKP